MNVEPPIETKTTGQTPASLPHRSQSGFGTVSVLIATFNRAAYIGECLQGMLGQTCPVTEIVVVDDGSTDTTPQVLAAYGQQIVYLRKENGGKSTALNLALERTTSDWVWFFDDDDVALPDALERFQQALSAQPSAEFAYSGQIIGLDRPGQPMQQQRAVKLPPVGPAALFNHALKQFPFLMQGMLVRRQAVERAGRFDVRYLRGQDYEFCLRLLRTAQGVALAEPTFIWRVHDGVRGPSQQQHHVATRGKVWHQYSAMMGRELRQTLPMGDYLVPRVPGEPSDPLLLMRAHVQRMCVMASKGLVPELLEDLQWVGSSPEGERASLGPIERDAVWKVATYDSFLSEALAAPGPLARQLVRAAGKGGRDVLKALVSGLMWTVRSGDLSLRDRGRLAWFAVRILALSTALSLSGGYGQGREKR